MTSRNNCRQADNGIKWIHVKAAGCCEFWTVFVWAGETVEQFKQILGLSAQTMVTPPTVSLPLPDGAHLFDFIKDFDTVMLTA
ncbi:hypothetical protein HYR54_05460 [Candidatus Acetothermia bacterium]|nr:hypothetical protein [Candidatus Acetothermia bacterium]